jgi:hypothetical protein
VSRVIGFVLLLAACEQPPDRRIVGPRCNLPATSIDVPTFHGDRARLGWNPREIALSPATVGGGHFGQRWSSPQLDHAVVGGHDYAPHLFASPLYIENVRISPELYSSVIIAATTNAFIYAIQSDFACGDAVSPPGTILWKTALGSPTFVPGLDGGMPLGVLSTPFVDLTSGRIYVASADAQAGWQVWAIDLASGHVLRGWPVTLTNEALGAVNANGPALFQAAQVVSQRGALNLSNDRATLYVPFGAYGDGGVGWMVALDTRTPSVVGAFSGAPSMEATANGGIWGSGGPAIAPDGHVYATTGNSPPKQTGMAHVWGNSVLAWKQPLELDGTYTPWNFCPMEQYDTDLAGGSPVVIPEFDAGTTGTPRLLAFGGKQGNLYLLDRDHLPGRLDQRQPCGCDPSADRSLLPPDPQPQFGTRGPLNVFGPYSEMFANLDRAKSRTTPAYYRDDAGTSYLFAAGSTKAAVDSEVSVPPCLARVKLVTTPGQPAYVALDRFEMSLTFINPGPPVVTSNGGHDAVVWVLDENAKRAASLVAPDTPHPILYAVDGQSMVPLWRSAPAELFVGGKYSQVTVAHGVVLVGTDRIQAFGLR